MPSQDVERSTVGSPSVVAYPDVNSSKEARTIGRLKLVLVAVSFGLLVMTVLFIWQIAKKDCPNEVKQLEKSGSVGCFLKKTFFGKGMNSLYKLNVLIVSYFSMPRE